MKDGEAEELFDKGLKAFREGNLPSALSFFERASGIDPSPRNNSYLAYFMARERGQIKKAIELCREAIEKEPDNTALYLNMGRVYLLARQKEDAIRAFREGLSRERNQEIIDELNRFGARRKPVFSFLSRANPVNKCLGFILSRLGLSNER